ncbi:Receptor-type tyrosine-protein phosphatase gamma [Echinococcus granulosus]|uniref:protein-tyrosine-phosphatase n=1 Tax=Echinococcus granulosus TaxID=6210 RepID=A0A068X3A9_ECHGR|nr:Receptor-type tyrosine-protein phosphatase gamma [Echinococcus granulosus]CDS24384.1 receptor type tyrosine protein phosphatase zeta [Echinococcus granulosus]
MLTIFILLYQFLSPNFTVYSLSASNDSNINSGAAISHLFPIHHSVRSGSNVSLSCPLSGPLSSQGSVLWLGPFNHTLNSTDTPQLDNVAISSDRLDIFNVSRSHEGNYSCFRDGESTAFWTLFVLDIPTLPNNLRLSALNQSTIFLRWKNDRQVPNSLIYEIQVTGPQNKSSSVSAAQQKLVVNGLSPYSKYFVRLTPRDPIGLGPVSLNGSVCTKPGTPTAAPNITLTSFTNTSATFNLSAGDITPLSDNSFSCPGSYKPPEHLFGPFFGFRLALEMLFFRKTINVTLINNQTESYTVEQLLPYTSYRVNVSIYNGRTFGPPSVLNFTTREGLPDPPLLQVESRSIDSLRVSLTSSDNRGVVLGYLIKWTECSNSSTVASAETEETYFAIQGLRNATCYQMQAAARTSVGLGDFSLLTQDFTSCPDFPPPTLFNISATLEGIKVSWVYADPPSSPDGNHCFLACMQSTISSICEEVTFNSTFRDNGIFSYTFPFRGVNLLGGQEIVLKFTVRSVCRPRDCKIDWPCQALGATSNVLQLDLDHLAEMFSRPAEFGELSDKAIGGIIGAVFAIFLMLCCVGALSIFYCRSSRVYKRRGGVGGLGDDFGMGCGGGDRTDDARTPLVTPKMRSFEDSPYKPIPAERLAQHVASYHVDDDAGYQAEFEAIEQSVRTSWPTSVARLPDNMAKNRYTNVFPYDHTRVILKNGRKSDYINANYVDGFCRPRAFIAAQGPKDTTFDDFWQMVWDENSNIIVMISNFVERGRRKCDQYWPSSGPQTYGNISVQMLSEDYLACYVARVFLVKNVKCKKFAKERIVRHYQYTDWRDFDVPPSPLPVLVFVKTTIKEWTPSRGPIIVHCSAGVGRTGTYICIESLIRQLEAEKQVNIRGFLEHIRQQRMKLVQTEQQYAFIHDALREYLLCPEHEILAMSFPAYVQCLRLPDAAGICTDQLPRVYEFTEARKPVNVTKNRLSRRLLPTDLRRVVLPSEGGVEGASYINASVVQGYHRLQEFIVTQHPIPGTTEADFWRMVWDKNSSLVVVLSSEQADLFPDFWPIEVHDPREIGWLRVSFCNSEEVSEGLTRYEFLLSSSREDYALTCQLWRLHAWPITVTEEACGDFLRLHSILVSNRTSAANGSTIVVDGYGGNRAGIFVAVNFLINQLTLSGYIDVYYIVKMLHLQRTGIFESPADLDFIYSVMEQFLLEMQQQDDSSSFLGNDTSSSPGYANLSLFNGKLLSPVTYNSKPSSANGDAIPPKSTLFPFSATSLEMGDGLNAVEKTGRREVDVEETESTLELHSLTSDTNVGDVSISPSLIGVLTSVKRPLNNGFVVKEMVLPPPLPPPPNQSPPPWPPRGNLEMGVGEVNEGEDPTPTTSLVVEGGSNLNLDDVDIIDGVNVDDTELTMTV